MPGPHHDQNGKHSLSTPIIFYQIDTNNNCLSALGRSAFAMCMNCAQKNQGMKYSIHKEAHRETFSFVESI